VIADGIYEPLLDKHEDVFAYMRKLTDQELLVIVNFMGKETEVKLESNVGKDYRVILENYGGFELGERFSLKAYEAVVLLKNVHKNNYNENKDKCE
jgi:hypothetical protein